MNNIDLENMYKNLEEEYNNPDKNNTFNWDRIKIIRDWYLDDGQDDRAKYLAWLIDNNKRPYRCCNDIYDWYSNHPAYVVITPTGQIYDEESDLPCLIIEKFLGIELGKKGNAYTDRCSFNSLQEAYETILDVMIRIKFSLN